MLLPHPSGRLSRRQVRPGIPGPSIMGRSASASSRTRSKRALPGRAKTGTDRNQRSDRKILHGRHLAEATISKYDVLLNKQLLPFAEAKGFRFLCELDVESMRE